MKNNLIFQKGLCKKGHNIYSNFFAPKEFRGKTRLNWGQGFPRWYDEVTVKYGDYIEKKDGFTVEEFKKIVGFEPHTGDHTSINGLYSPNYTFYVNKDGIVGYRDILQSYYSLAGNRPAREGEEVNHSIFTRLPNLVEAEEITFVLCEYAQDNPTLYIEYREEKRGLSFRSWAQINQ